MKKVASSACDPEWPRILARIRSYVWPAVRDVAIDVEHVGSTSVSGLMAKPVIDACIVVASREKVQTCIERLASLGYVHRVILVCRSAKHFAVRTSFQSTIFTSVRVKASA